MFRKTLSGGPPVPARLRKIHWFIALGALLTAVPLAAQQSGRALTIEDFYRLKTVGAPEISPDGRWVAFTVSTRIEETNGDKSEVWLVAADGSTPARRVSADGSDASSPQWTPDSRLRFAAEGHGWSVDPTSPDRITEGEAIMGGGRGGR